MDLTKDAVTKLLQDIPEYQIHRSVNKPNENTILALRRREQIQADLMDLSNLSRKRGNKNHRMILVLVDVFSRYGWGIALKSKSARELTSKFQAGLKENGPIDRLVSDQEPGFDYLKESK